MSATGMTIDVGQWIERLIKLEHENESLRAEIRRVEKGAADALEEACQGLWDRTATLNEDSNTLEFEVSNEAGDVAYARVAVVGVEVKGES